MKTNENGDLHRSGFYPTIDIGWDIIASPGEDTAYLVIRKGGTAFTITSLECEAMCRIGRDLVDVGKVLLTKTPEVLPLGDGTVGDE